MQLLKPAVFSRALFTLLLLGTLIAGFTRTLDTSAQAPLDAAFERALVTYGIARGINGVISVIQGTEFAIEPAGVGVTLTPGEILDPMNDLIERFSWIVLAATTSLGAQKVFIGIGASNAFQLTTLAATAVLLVFVWKPAMLPNWSRPLLFRLALSLLFLRFIIPVIVLSNSLVYDLFLDAQYQESSAMLEDAEANIQELKDEEVNTIAGEQGDGLLAALSKWYDQTTKNINVQARIDGYVERLGNASDQIIDLTTIFILQTIIFPLLLLWLGLRAAQAIVSNQYGWLQDQKSP